MISILAVSKNNVIGNSGKLPWSFKKDMKWFKTLTTIDLFGNKSNHNLVVMGRKTWESIGSKPLVNRINWVISSSLDIDSTKYNGKVCSSKNIDEFNLDTRSFHKDSCLFCIGGAMLYKEIQPSAMIVTEIDSDFNGDTLFDWRSLGDEYKVDASSLPFSDINLLDGSEYNMSVSLVLQAKVLRDKYQHSYYRYLFEKSIDNFGLDMLV